MNHEEISEHILAELECSLEELESLGNREKLERQGIDIQNDIERYSALIDSFKLMVEKAKAWDKYKTHMESHIAGEINEEELVSDLKSDYFESGETNA